MSDEISLIDYMKERFDQIDKKQDRQYAEIIKKLDPVVEWKEKADGSIKALRWLMVTGMSFMAIILTVIGLYLAFKGLKP